MKSKIAFTKKDLAVALVCLVFVLMSFGAVGGRGRERAKHAVCLSNLKQLSLAWRQYADDNDGRIVNGAPCGHKCTADVPSWDTDHTNETPWIGRAAGEPEECQLAAIKAGAMWPYVKNLGPYRCPTGFKGELVTYAIMDGMNGMPMYRGDVRRPGVWIKKLSEIQNPPPSERMVFIDEGWLAPDSYAVHIDMEMWWDDPPSRHGDGTNLSFADGHCEYYKWKGLWTIQYARSVDRFHPRNDVRLGGPIDIDYDGVGDKYVEATRDDYEDLYFIQKGCWGGLDYTPTYGELP
jgi:prepilin-type processing-associated H-X9-DG protein